MKIFISSTYYDLRYHRNKVIEDLTKAGYQVVSMENFTANPEEPKKFSVDMVKACDLFILLVGFRRGFVPEGENKSITQVEYECAVKNGLGVLIFQLSPDNEWPRELKKYDERKTDLELIRWKETLEKRHIVEYFDITPHSLNVLPAVRMWERYRKEENMLVNLVTFIVPFKNGGKEIIETLDWLINRFEPTGVNIILVDDASNDLTRSFISVYNKNNRFVSVIKNFYPELHKIGAIKTAIERIDTDFVFLLDADTTMEECGRSLENLVSRMAISQPPIDVHSFPLKPLRPKGLLQRLQQLEYAIATDSIRYLLDTVLCISGAASLWRKSSLELLIKKHSGKFEGDDLELTLLAYESDMRIKHENSIAAHTKTPGKLSTWISQRSRWDFGFFRLLMQPRFWKKLFSRPTQVGAIFRAIAISEVLLHPFKLLSFIYPFILYILITNSTGNDGHVNNISILLSIFSWMLTAALILGLTSIIYISDAGWKRVKYALLWIIYMCSPYFVILGVWLLKWHPHLDLPPRLDIDQYLAIPPMQEFLTVIGPNVILIIVGSLLWWLPLSYILIRLSNDRTAKKFGIHTLLLPFYFFLQLVLLRTSTLICMPFLRKKNYRKVKGTIFTITVILSIIIVAFTIKVINRVENIKTIAEPTDYLVNNLRSYQTYSHEKVAFINSYQDWKDQFWVYDISLAIIAFTSSQHKEQAQSLLKGLEKLQNDDGSWYPVYSTLPPFQALENKKDTAANAWVAISALYYQVNTGDTSFIPLVGKCFQWLKKQAIDLNINGSEYLVMPNKVSDSDRPLSNQNDLTGSTIVVYALCNYADSILGGEIYSKFGSKLLEFLCEVAWDNNDGKFDEFETPGYTKAESPSVTIQSWGLLTLGSRGPNGENFSRALDWCEKELSTSLKYSIGGDFTTGIEGICYSRNEFPYLIYVEGTLQLAAAFYAVDNKELGNKWMGRCKIFRARNGGVFYSVGAGHEDFLRRPAVSSTCWYYFNKPELHINPLVPPTKKEKTISKENLNLMSSLKDQEAESASTPGRTLKAFELLYQLANSTSLSNDDAIVKNARELIDKRKAEIISKFEKWERLAKELNGNINPVLDEVKVIQKYESEWVEEIKESYPDVFAFGSFNYLTLFYDNFDVSKNEWHQIRGDWKISDDGFFLQRSAGPRYINSIIYVDHPQAANATIETFVRVIPDVSTTTIPGDIRNQEMLRNVRYIIGAGIVFRMKDDNNFYMFRLAGEEGAVLGKMVNNAWVDLSNPRSSDYLKEKDKFSESHGYLLKVEVYGNSIICHINDSVVASRFDSTFSLGKFGLCTFKCRAAFDFFKVYDKTAVYK
jgi:cellulose synthase/poly-beta-1,6-N-acetylglucosamine synthase-like glycosyltransferase